MNTAVRGTTTCQKIYNLTNILFTTTHVCVDSCFLPMRRFTQSSNWPYFAYKISLPYGAPALHRVAEEKTLGDFFKG